MAGKRVFVDLRFFYAHAALLGCKEQRTRSVSGRSRHAPAGTERDDNPFAIAPIARHLAGRERQLKSAVGKLSANALLAPLRVAVFRRTWSDSLFSNFGLREQGVGAAGALTELTRTEKSRVGTEWVSRGRAGG